MTADRLPPAIPIEKHDASDCLFDAAANELMQSVSSPTHLGDFDRDLKAALNLKRAEITDKAITFIDNKAVQATSVGQAFMQIAHREEAFVRTEPMEAATDATVPIIGLPMLALHGALVGGLDTHAASTGAVRH